MKKITLLILMLTFHLAYAQNSYRSYKSLKYNYSIEYPNSFTKKNIIGKNIDFKVVDSNGNSIIVVVKKLLGQGEKLTINDILKIPSASWESNLQLPNVKVVKKGKVSVDGQLGMFLFYTSKDINDPITLYYMNYFFIFNEYIYNLTATCNIKDISHMQPIFFRALQSFTFPN